jgi:hypothetical protein
MLRPSGLLFHLLQTGPGSNRAFAAPLRSRERYSRLCLTDAAVYLDEDFMWCGVGLESCFLCVCWRIAVHGAELTPGASEKLLQALLQFVDDRRNVGVALEAIRCICFVGWHAVSFVRTGLGAIVSRLQVTYRAWGWYCTVGPSVAVAFAFRFSWRREYV